MDWNKAYLRYKEWCRDAQIPKRMQLSFREYCLQMQGVKNDET